MKDFFKKLFKLLIFECNLLPIRLHIQFRCSSKFGYRQTFAGFIHNLVRIHMLCLNQNSPQESSLSSFLFLYFTIYVYYV